METWTDLATCLLAELKTLRDQDAVLAFERLMMVQSEVGLAFHPIWNCGSPHEDGDPVLKATPDFLRAVGGDVSGDVVGRLYTALTHRALDVSAVPKDMFDDLLQSDRAALLERLAALDPDSAEGRRLRPVLSHVLLAERDIDRLIGMAQTLWLWDRVDAAEMLNRLMAAARYVPHFPSLVVGAMLEDAAEKDCGGLLDQALSFCEALGEHNAAQQIRFRLFKEMLAVPFAREWLRHIPADNDPRAGEDQLLTSVRNDPRRGQALLFLLEWPSIADAISLARACHEEMDDVKGWQLKDASAQLEDVAPDAALKLYRKSHNMRSPSGYLPEPVLSFHRPPWYASWPTRSGNLISSWHT